MWFPLRRGRSSLQGGRFYSLPEWQRLPCRCAAGECQRPPCPHFDKSGGEGGTLHFAGSTAVPGGGRACLPKGQRLPCWGLCEAQRAEHRPQHCPARRRMTAPLRGPEYRFTLLAVRCCPPAGGLLSRPHYKRGVATGGSVAPQRHRGTEGGTWLGCRAFRAAAQCSDDGSEVAPLCVAVAPGVRGL
jgi:hypothetical protein